MVKDECTDSHANQEENKKNYILQLVVQSITNDDSPLRLYNEDSELVPIPNFSFSLFQLLDKKHKKSNKSNISGYKFQFNKISQYSTDTVAPNVIGIRNEEEVIVHPCTFIQYKIETQMLHNLKLKLQFHIENSAEIFFATFLGTQFFHDYESPHKSVVGTVIDESFSVVGEIKLEYTIIKPWERQTEFTKKFDKYSIVTDPCSRPIMVGHRGSGVTYCENPSEYMENSINSFIAAYECGADFVELDIQLTKDNNIVVFHDTDTCVVLPTNKGSSGKKKIKNRLKKNSVGEPFDCYSSNQAGIEINCDSSYERYNLDFSSECQKNESDCDSCSTTDSVSSLNVSIRHLNIDQLRAHKFVNSKSDLVNYFKPASPNISDCNDIQSQPQFLDPIGGLFPTLSEVLKELPLNLGVNIEIKSPQESKNGMWENDFGQNYDRNKLIDLTLDVIFHEKQKSRKIVFSSFDPWICTMLRQKQDRYPVLFLVEAKIDSVAQSIDIRMSTVDGAILFAAGENLDGIVCCIDPVLHRIDSVVKNARHFNLAFFTYGESNNNLENILLQSKANVDGIITDRLKDLLPKLIKRTKQNGK